MPNEEFITYTITALTNDRAQLIEKTAVISYSTHTATLIYQMWISEGFIVKVTGEN